MAQRAVQQTAADGGRGKNPAAADQPVATGNPNRQPYSRSRRPRIWSALVTLLATAGTAMAQDPTPTPGLSFDGDYLVFSVNEKDGLPLRDFVKMAEQITGKNFTYTENELTQVVDRVQFVGTKRMLKDEFYGFFQSMLYIRSFALVVRGRGNTEIIEIVSLNGTKRNEIAGSAQFVGPDRLTDFASQTGLNIITYVRLEHIRASAASQTLRPFFAASGQNNLQIGNVGNERSLLLQGFAPQVANAYELLRLVDQPEEVPDQEVKLVELEHASSEELEPILREILGDRRTGGPAEGVGGGVVAGQQNQLKILAHTTLDGIILSGTRDQVLEAMNIIAFLDVAAESTQEDTHVVRLSNVQAEELRTTLNQFINEDLQAQTAQQGQGGTPTRRPRKTVVFDHKASNSLLISGTPSAVESLKRTIEKLDVRQAQVLIEAAIVELTTSDAVRFGIELGAIDISQDDFTRPFGFTGFGQSTFQDTDDNGLPDTRLPDFENPSRGFTGGIIKSKDFAVPVLINALASDSRNNVLSLPSVVVNNNENANVSSTEERPTQTNQQGTATTQSGFGGFQGAGIELSISPSISTNNYLRLNITLAVSRFLSSFDATAATPGVKVERRITTQVTMPSGATMVLGGVMEDSEDETDDGVPFLKDIPLLGWLFRSYAKTKRKTNLYFFLTPHILDEEDFTDLSEISFRRKMEAAQYIGHKRMQLVDRKWREPSIPERLEDTGSTVEDLDRYGGFEIPSYRRPNSGAQQPPLPPRERNTVIGGGR